MDIFLFKTNISRNYDENNSFSDLEFKKRMTIFNDKCVEQI